MSPQKHLIRRYLLATLIGTILGLLGMVVSYENYLERNRASMPEEYNVANQLAEQSCNPARCDEVIVLVNVWIVPQFSEQPLRRQHPLRLNPARPLCCVHL